MLLSTTLCALLVAACGGGGSDLATDVSASQGPSVQVASQPSAVALASMAGRSLAAQTQPAQAAADERIGVFEFNLGTASTEDITEAETAAAAMVQPFDDQGDAYAAVTKESSSFVEKPPIATTAAAVDMQGSGLREHLSANCTPTIRDDFIDAGSWDHRRLLPRDCLRIDINPPLFSWPQPSNRDTQAPWAVTIRRTTAPTIEVQRQVASPRLFLDQALQAGDYEWDVSYRTKGGQSVTSSKRRFSVAADAISTKFPSGSKLLARALARTHPRVRPPGANFRAIAASARSGELSPMYDSILAVADTALQTPIPLPNEGTSVASLARSSGQKAASTDLRKTLEQERQFVEALGFAALLTSDTRYRDAGIARTMVLAQWSPDGQTSEASFDYANRAIYSALSLALDLYADGLTNEQVATIVAPLRSRLAQTIARFARLDIDPFDSHVDVIAWSVLESLLYAVGTPGFDDAQTWLANTWDLLLTTANTWGADEGGFANGVAYSWYRMAQIAQTLSAVRVITGLNLAGHPSLARLGDSLVAFTAPRGQHRGAFGDGAEVTSHFSNYAFNQFRLYALLTADPVHNWYWKQDTEPYRPGRYFSPWHLMLAGAGVTTPATHPPQKQAWAFDDAGVTAIHSDSSATDRSSVFFRSSEFGSWVHSHADQNAFVFNSRGKDLLVSGGHYPYFLSPHHATVTRSTRFNNALTFDGGIGQAEEAANMPVTPGKPRQSRDARGVLLNHGDNGTWAGSTGDATLAYRYRNTASGTWTPLLSSALRSVAYNRAERVLIVYDYALSEQARSWELNFNALNPLSLTGGTVRVSNGGALGCIDVHAAPRGGFRLERGFPVAPENGGADQYRAIYSSASPSTRLVAVSVIREDCRDVPVSVSFEGDGANVSVNGGTPVHFDKQRLTLP